MTDLIIHIGLTKTASTFFQKKIFGGKIYTLDRKIDWNKDREISKKFQKNFLSDDWNFRSDEFGLSFFEGMAKQQSGPIVISHESLFLHNPFLDKPEVLQGSIDKFSRKLNEIRDCWKLGKVKVFYLYRDQADWLPSMYANSAYLIKKASQKDFELRVRAFLEKNEGVTSVIDWAYLNSQLIASLDEENVLAVEYESFKKSSNWKTICEFCGLEFDLTKGYLAEKTINVKRYSDKAEWDSSDKFQKLADISALQFIRPIARKLFNHKKRQTFLSFFGMDAPKIEMPSELKVLVHERYCS